MKNNFKVGQKVRIRAWEDMEKEFGTTVFGEIKCRSIFTKEMKHLCGRVATIRHISCEIIGLNFEDKSGRTYWTYSTDMIEPVDETIVIYRGKKNPDEVIALDKSTGKKAIAKCSPKDTFDFETGAKLAFERLMTPEPKVTFRVLCVKDDFCIGKLLWKKGKVYEFKDGKCEKENGFESFKYVSFNDFINQNPSYKKHFVELKDGDDPKEILKKHDEIKIGDTVEVVDNGCTCSRYSAWKCLGKYKQNFVECKAPENNKKYKVVNIAEHEVAYGNNLYALIQNPDTTQVFIISMKGIRKV